MPEQLDIYTHEVSQGVALGEPAACSLFAGRLTMTVQSKKTGTHITIRANCKRKGARWERATFDQATHVFVEVPRPDGQYADKVGTYYPTGKHAGKFWSDPTADPARVWAAVRVLRIAGGFVEYEDELCRALLGTNCFYCGRELTDPESIERQIGPQCAETISRANHQVKQMTAEAQQQPARIPAVYERATEPSVPPNDPGRAGADWSLAESTAGIQPARAGLVTLVPGRTAAQALADLENDDSGHVAEMEEAAQT